MRQMEHFRSHQILGYILITSKKYLAVALEPIVNLFNILLKVEYSVMILQLLLFVDPQVLELTMIR
jgi:hypothetical protein